MTRRVLYFTPVTLLLALAAAQSHAEPELAVTDDTVLLEDTVLGVEVRLDTAGQLVSARSSYSNPVDFPDRRGLNKAYVVAEEKAKAQLVRFMSQDISTTRTVTELDDVVGTARRSRDEQGSTWTKEDVRTVKESLSEISTSVASGHLEGVRLLSRNYDEAREEVTVVIGINPASLAGAAQLGGNSTGSPRRAAAGTPGSFPAQPSESMQAADAQEF
jgi:hypothetical protein